MAEKRKEKLQGRIKPVLLAKVVALQTAAPDLYNFLKENEHRYLPDIERYCRSKKSRITEQLIESTSGSARTIQESRKLDEKLAGLVNATQAVERILAIEHSPKSENVYFKGLSLENLRLYFTLTKSADAPGRSNIDYSDLPFEPQMVRIPAGTFIMGDEEFSPQHEEELDEYFIGKYPVTNREYQMFIKDVHYKPQRDWDGEKYPPEKGDHPVVNVNWRDAQAYCSWLHGKTGKNYVLPTEAQWEKAARGTDGRTYSWGEELPDRNYCNLEGWFGAATPVGQFSPLGDSTYGCSDMAGNVCEWTNSIYRPYPYVASDGREDENVKGNNRVLRGGGFFSPYEIGRCAARDGIGLGDHGDFIGFRVVVVSPIRSSEL